MIRGNLLPGDKINTVKNRMCSHANALDLIRATQLTQSVSFVTDHLRLNTFFKNARKGKGGNLQF